MKWEALAFFVLCLVAIVAACLGVAHSEERVDRHLVHEHSLKFGKDDALMEFYDREHGVRCYVARGSYDVTTVACVKEK